MFFYQEGHNTEEPYNTSRFRREYLTLLYDFFEFLKGLKFEEDMDWQTFASLYFQHITSKLPASALFQDLTIPSNYENRSPLPEFTHFRSIRRIFNKGIKSYDACNKLTLQDLKRELSEDGIDDITFLMLSNTGTGVATTACFVRSFIDPDFTIDEPSS